MELLSCRCITELLTSKTVLVVRHIYLDTDLNSYAIFFTGVVSNPMPLGDLKDLRNDIIEIEQQVLGGNMYKQRFENQSSIEFINVLTSISSKEHYTFSRKNFLHKVPVQSVLLICFRLLNTIYTMLVL